MLIEIQNKKAFFKLYKSVQNSNVDLYGLDKKELNMIYKMMKEEIKMIDKAIIDYKRKLENLKNSSNSPD